MPLNKFFNYFYTSDEIMLKLKGLQVIAENELKQAVWTYVYEAYTPSVYERTFELYNSVTSKVDIITMGRTYNVSFKVYFDTTKMNHWTLFGSKKNPVLDPRDKIPNVAPLIDEGFTWGEGRETAPYLTHRPEANFMERACKEIEDDLRQAVKNLVVIEARKYGSKKTYG